jgi:flavin-dependent dehydrogenase
VPAAGARADATVAVFGTGPAGCAAAAELARRGYRVALLGRTGNARPNVGECLPPGIRPQLEKAGVWEDFLRAGHTPSAGIRSYWGSDEPGDRHFIFSPYGAGWHVDRLRFDAMLRDAAVRNGAVWLELGEDTVCARFVIDATGRAAVFARRCGARRRSLDRLMGIAGYFSAGPEMEPALTIEAVADGWWYSAPLPRGKLIAVCMTDATVVQRDGLMKPDRWMARLAQAKQHFRRVQRHAGRLVDGLRIVPAESSFLDRIAGDGWIAAGDAAATVDPLSSMGILTAISSGLGAAQTADAWLSGDDNAPAAYADRVRRGYAVYLASREACYRMDRRWPDSGFWASRQRSSSTLSQREKVAAI